MRDVDDWFFKVIDLKSRFNTFEGFETFKYANVSNRHCLLETVIDTLRSDNIWQIISNQFDLISLFNEIIK